MTLLRCGIFAPAVLLSALNFCLPACAQTVWESGYIITPGNDTLRGKINYRDWAVSPEVISFMESPGTTERSYDATNTTGFAIPSRREFYQVGEVAIRYYARVLADKKEDPLEKIDTIHVFMEVILKKDSFSLLKLMDAEGEARFVLAVDKKFTVLENIEYMKRKDGKLFKVSLPLYQSQIRSLLVGCPSFSFGEVYYDERSLANLCQRYLSCLQKDQGVQVNKKNKVMLKLGASGGVSLWNGGPFPYVGFSLEHLLDKRFSNRFLHFTIGTYVADDYDDLYGVPTGKPKAAPYLALYGGTYFGTKKLRWLVFTGYSNLNGALDSGVGISLNKTLSITAHGGLIDAVIYSANLSFEAKLLF